MTFKALRILTIVALTLLGAAVSFSQVSADNKSPIIGSQEDADNDNRPKSFRDTLIKLRIDKEKKEYEELIERAAEAHAISVELDEVFERTGRLTTTEIDRLATAEKLIKKIRSELGGNDDGDKDLDRKSKHPNVMDAIKTFRSTSANLFDELKKTSRFTVSAAAIQTSNSLLAITRFLRKLY